MTIAASTKVTVRDEAATLVQDLREMVNDWPDEVADVIRELFGFDDLAVLNMLVKSTRLQVGGKPYPRVVQTGAQNVE